MVRITPDPKWGEGKSKLSKVVSIDRLKLYKGPLTLPPEADDDITMSDDEAAEVIDAAVSQQLQRGSPTKRPTPPSAPQRAENDSDSNDDGDDPHPLELDCNSDNARRLDSLPRVGYEP